MNVKFYAFIRSEVKLNLLDNTRGSKSLSCFEKTRPSHRLERLGLDLVQYSRVEVKINLLDPTRGSKSLSCFEKTLSSS